MANKETKDTKKQKDKASHKPVQPTIKAPKAAKKDKTKGQTTYHKIKASCACGAEFETGSVLDSIRVDICSSCHPFYTGENKIVDTEGRVEKFKKRSQYLKK